ncbi:MAG: hypothetical protein ACJAW1_002764 [Glaciecola sp.]|jgi:hypothetical protein
MLFLFSKETTGLTNNYNLITSDLLAKKSINEAQQHNWI